MIWHDIAQRCDELAVPGGGTSLYLTRSVAGATGSRWLIGPYNVLYSLAPRLRTEEQLREALAKAGVRFGERASDVPPAGARQPRIGEKGAPVLSEHRAQRQTNVLPGAPACRETDMYPNAASFWQTQTLQAHHIVEKSILGALAVNRLDLADHLAPSVLLVAELHQRLFTAEMAGVRGQFTKAMTGAEAYDALKRLYDALYSRPVMAELRVVADLINQAVRDRK